MAPGARKPSFSADIPAFFSLLINRTPMSLCSLILELTCSELICTPCRFVQLMVRCTFFSGSWGKPCTISHRDIHSRALWVPTCGVALTHFAFSQKPTLFLDFLSVLQLTPSHIVPSNPSRGELAQILPYFRQSQNKPNSVRSMKMKSEAALK